MQFQLKRPQAIRSWAVCVLMDRRGLEELEGDDAGSLKNWMRVLQTTFRELGMQVPQTLPAVHRASRDPGRYPTYEVIEPEIEAALDAAGAMPDVLFVIIPRKGAMLP